MTSEILLGWASTLASRLALARTFINIYEYDIKFFSKILSSELMLASCPTLSANYLHDHK